jgi:hypothetical protein
MSIGQARPLRGAWIRSRSLTAGGPSSRSPRISPAAEKKRPPAKREDPPAKGHEARVVVIVRLEAAERA